MHVKGALAPKVSTRCEEVRLARARKRRKAPPLLAGEALASIDERGDWRIAYGRSVMEFRSCSFATSNELDAHPLAFANDVVDDVTGFEFFRWTSHV